MSEFDPNNEGPLTQLTPEILEGYVKGELSGSLREKVQAYLAANPFEAEAMEGLLGQPGLDLTADMSDLNERLQAKITPERQSGFVWWRLAAVIALLAASAVIVFYLVPQTKNDSVTVDQEALENQNEVSAIDEGFQATDQETNPQSNALAEPSAETSGPVSTPLEDNKSSQKETDTPQAATPLSASRAQQAKVSSADAGTIERDKELGEGEFADEEAPTIARSAAPKKVNSKREVRQDYLSLSDSMEIPYEYKVVVGKVMNSVTGSPVAGANVSVKGTSLVTVSDQNGFFHFEAPIDAQSLISNRVGFGSQEIPIEEQAQITVFLEAEVHNLMEVATEEVEESKLRSKRNSPQASGNSSAKNMDDDGALEQEAAAPAGLNSYLAANTIYPQKAQALGIQGTVIVSFKVLADGTITNFIIEKKLGFGCDEEAVNVLKNGPRWQPAQSRGKSVPSTSQIKVKFPPIQ